MSITVLNLTEASALLRSINKRDIKDVRAIDLDLALVLENGHKIIISRGAVAAVNSPQMVLEFADGDIALGDVFEKLNHIEVPAEAAVTVTSKEIKRYGIKRVVKPKTARDEEDATRPDSDEARPTEALASDGGTANGRASELADGGSGVRQADVSGIGEANTSSTLTAQGSPGTESAASKGSGLSWPVIAGGLGLLAAAGGGGGGGGGGSNAGAAATAGSGGGGGTPATLSGAAALGPLNNATITAYDAEGRVIGKAVPVVNGRYTLVLEQSGYKGLILLAVRDNTPGVADNYADEATLRVNDLGTTVLRAVALADGSNQIINVTALTELATQKAGLTTGQTSLAAAQVGATMVTGANAAVSSLFKVDILSGDVAPVTTTNAQGAAVINPEFARTASVTARNYGIALKSIANLTPTDPTRYGTLDAAIKKLADSLQFTDALLTRLKWSDSTTQSDLFGERLNARANDPALTAAERQQARTLYELVHSGDTIFKLRNTSPAYFGAEFSENGVPLVDMSKPVYRTGPADSDWYVWSAQGGGYIISRRGNSGEWYREAPSAQPAQTPEAPAGILVQTGAGDDRLTVGSFGKASALKATVTDFTVGMDRVKVFGQVVNQDFVKNYVTASDLNGSTRLQIDLDGAGAGKLYYHLTLQGVQYNPSTIGSIFGV
ncbi:hypothetical protein [Herbaspirillum huttiense]|uniref:hypothetical protein n=1 Tax=Herbaspirillum huttiense TaxID=863372 RepID=UPI0039AEF32F